jgi:hypothetical protein
MRQGMANARTSLAPGHVEPLEAALSHKMHAADPAKPLKAIRRFDVFAEVSRLEALKDGRPEDEAKGHGIWLAKVVASRRFGAKSDGAVTGAGSAGTREKPAKKSGDDAFKAVGGELQTDEMFDSEIIDRMGARFYDDVFAPAVKAAIEAGQKYEDIRDSIRLDWKPRR